MRIEISIANLATLISPLREFLELDSELPKASQTASLSAKNVVKFISKVGEKVTNMTIKMEETDEW